MVLLEEEEPAGGSLEMRDERGNLARALLERWARGREVPAAGGRAGACWSMDVGMGTGGWRWGASLLGRRARVATK